MEQRIYLVKIFKPKLSKKLESAVKKLYLSGVNMKQIRLEPDFFAPIQIIDKLNKDFQVLKNNIVFSYYK